MLALCRDDIAVMYNPNITGGYIAIILALCMLVMARYKFAVSKLNEIKLTKKIILILVKMERIRQNSKMTSELVVILMGFSVVMGVAYWFGKLFNQIIN